MVSRPVVSVVIPVLDVEATIAAQLGALARQDFTGPWEIVVADNGSRDRTADIVREWSDRLPIRIVDAGGFADAGHARNVGAAAAEGELLAFCDGDDEVRSDWLRVIVDALQVAPLVVGVYDHSKLNPPKPAAVYDDDEYRTPRRSILPGGGGGNLGVRRVVFEQAGGFPVGYRRGGDTAFCWRAKAAGHDVALEPRAAVDRRLKVMSLRQLFVQHVRAGAAAVRTYKTYRDHGMLRSPLRDIVYDYASVPICLATGRSYRAARVAGWRVGRLLGSVRLRAMYL